MLYTRSLLVIYFILEVKWKLLSCVRLFVTPWTGSPWTLQANTGVGSLLLIQWIFPTQESNWDLLHYRQILYQLSYQWSPHFRVYMLMCMCVCSVTKLYPILCDPFDHSQPGSSLLGIFQAGILEWVAISSFRGSSQPRDQTRVFCIDRWIFHPWVTWEVAYVNPKLLIYPSPLYVFLDEFFFS